MATLTKESIDKWFNHNLDVENRVLYMGSVDRTSEYESGVDHLMAESFIKGLHVLESKNDNEITIIMNNPGGEWYHGMAIYDAIQNARCHCTIKVYGYAMSMGSIILQAADNRILMPNSRFMIHYGGTSFDDASLPLIEKWVNEERRINYDMEEIYLKAMLDKEEKEGHGYLAKTLSSILDSPKTFSRKAETKKEELRSVLKEMLNFDTILTAEETVDLGFADEIYKP
jgi:ATP-dependent protease ClpP protease subunit